MPDQRARNALEKTSKDDSYHFKWCGLFFCILLVLPRCVPRSPGWRLGTRWMSPSVVVFNRQAFAMSQFIAILIINCTLLHLSQFVIWQSLTHFFRIWKHSVVGIRNAFNSNTPLVTPISYRKETSLFFLRISSQTGHKYHSFQGFYSILVAGVCKVENLPQAK